MQLLLRRTHAAARGHFPANISHAGTGCISPLLISRKDEIFFLSIVIKPPLHSLQQENTRQPPPAISPHPEKTSFRKESLNTLWQANLAKNSRWGGAVAHEKHATFSIYPVWIVCVHCLTTAVHCLKLSGALWRSRLAATFSAMRCSLAVGWDLVTEGSGDV